MRIYRWYLSLGSTGRFVGGVVAGLLVSFTPIALHDIFGLPLGMLAVCVSCSGLFIMVGGWLYALGAWLEGR